MKLELDLTEEQVKFLKQYAQVYENEREIDCTRTPIVCVENRQQMVVDSSYEISSRFYVFEGKEYESLAALEADVKEQGYSKKEIKKMLKEVEILNIGYYYNPVAFFLTIAEAEKYVKRQRHNLINPRIYSRYIGYSNYGDLECLMGMLLELGKNLQEERK